MIFDGLGFATAYGTEPLPGRPGYGDVLLFHDPAVTGNAEGVVLDVRPRAGDAWIGNFTAGDYGINGAYATPEPDRMCVVAGGEVYMVPVLEPMRYSMLVGQVLDVRRGDNVLLLITGTDIHAHDGISVAWRTKRLSWDGIEVRSVSNERLVGRAWSAPRGDWVRFEVDLRNGRHTGGAYDMA